MLFAKRVFYWSGIYGILVLLPMFFLEHKLGIDFPPATNHPEQYYAFISVALAWQFAFLLIASDVNRYRPLMVIAMVEKFLTAGTAIWLFALGRIEATTLAPFLVDIILGFLFAASYVRSAEHFSSLRFRS
ncbi:MAG TPA: hypothetical protein P5149_08830 [Candidatus Competibacteraceae bacterium]|nr:hypothetical protein [Candidatus Competibacteraceae bacterium]MCP5132456.1 hypothetical protein [Gammaproteobacteria bacterium]HPF59774.1 hypothetical protein [Candidatus Competibacteraceae bacterium]HRY18498.1 hypothetical protein [Candidatus Competibacteraceae bacterium]